jgi:hypothetical protein
MTSPYTTYLFVGVVLLCGLFILYYGFPILLYSSSQAERRRRQWKRRERRVAKWVGMWSPYRERKKQYEKWEMEVLIPFWKKQKGYKAQRGFHWFLWPESYCFGTELEVHFDSIASVFRVMDSDEYRERVMKPLEDLAENVTVKISFSTGRTPDEIRYLKEE